MASSVFLPPEILARIFQFVAHDESGESKPLKRISFSHVSHHWREVASSTPILWHVIPLALSDCSTIMLERSKMADLVLYAGPGLKSTRIIQLALSHMVRVCEITIYMCHREFQVHSRIHKVLSQFAKSAPRLRSFCITLTDPDSSFTISLPQGFPLSDAPCLRQLVLTRCNFLDWDSLA